MLCAAQGVAVQAGAEAWSQPALEGTLQNAPDGGPQLEALLLNHQPISAFGGELEGALPCLGLAHEPEALSSADSGKATKDPEPNLL